MVGTRAETARAESRAFGGTSLAASSFDGRSTDSGGQRMERDQAGKRLPGGKEVQRAAGGLLRQFVRLS